ncbi:rod shape-determining protein MreC [Motiliproteus sediminis]|uniref:rod shape-determining protein MreC n=1 Tax=Motiliproteus sediminis TaxID=1468178 RepID=UPI001AEFB3AA
MRGCPISSIFRTESGRSGIVLILLLSAALMATDLLWKPMAHYRGYLTLLVTPVQWLVDVPTRVWMTVNSKITDRDALQQENGRLRSDILLMSRQLQRMDDLTTENARLRLLLNGSRRLDERVQLAELIGVNADPFIHQIVINKGLRDGAYLGQPVLDENGIMGQLVEVGPYTSRVLLITDNQHALPVQVDRSGFRALLLGNGSKQSLRLDHVPDTADIQVGDLLLSSGLGGRFPAGYPVAEVSEIVHDPGRPFALVRAVPRARLDKSRHLLLVTRQEPPLLDGPIADPVAAPPTASAPASSGSSASGGQP